MKKIMMGDLYTVDVVHSRGMAFERVQIRSYDDLVAECFDLDEAEHIVHSVNSYTRIASVLEKIRGVLEGHSIAEVENCGYDKKISEVLDIIEDALGTNSVHNSVAPPPDTGGIVKKGI